VRFPEETAYLKSIQPQLEEHLSNSTVGIGFTGIIRINLYTHGVQLSFQDGLLVITPWHPTDWSDGDAHFPANSFRSLLCGLKTAAQLAIDIADCWMTRNARILLDCIFPEFTGQV
jgi:hypothetical protein